MATATTDERVVDYDEFIDQQVVKTSRSVKTVELVTGVVLLGLALLGTLLVLVVIDHWVVGLGFWARLLGLVVIVISSLGILVAHIARPLVRPVNPEYSALAVERSFPGLNNALTSFLFFRDRPRMLRPSIYTGLRQQVATDLNQLPIDAAVDRGAIIRWGYGLVAVAAVWCAYILFSPKDPLQTVHRVLLPWREIARPSQVDILAVRPGSTEIFRGQTVDVQVEVHGLKEHQRPWIEYSTLDGQLSAQRLPLTQNGSGFFAGVLTTGQAGIHQDLEYRILAGDAVSPTFAVHTNVAPHIVIDRVEYDFPNYTELPRQVLDGLGDVRAIEGTRVHIFGRANQPIRTGHIALLPAPHEDSVANSGARQAPLIVDGQQAHVRFTLRMDSDRAHSVYRAYRLHFVNHQGLSSVDPVEHSIDVTPDLPPIVEIIEPTQRTIEIPENGWQQIEIRAVDPDFQLTRLLLIGRTRDRALFRRTLLEHEHLGQFTATFNFVPREFDLKSGDVMTYEAVAEDNRHSPLQGKPDPNRTVSWQYVIRIVPADSRLNELPPDPRNSPQANEEASPDADQVDNGNPQRNAQSQNSGDGQTGETDEQNQQNQNRQRAQDEAGAEETDDSGQGAGESGLQQNGGSGTDARRQELDSGQEGTSSSNQDSSREGSASQSTESRTDTAGAESSESGSETGDASARNEEESPAGEGQAADSEDPLPSSGERDGEVIDRIRRYLEETGELDSSPNERADAESSDAESANADGQAPETQPPGGTDGSQDPGGDNHDNAAAEGSPETSASDSGSNSAAQSSGARSTEQGTPDSQEGPSSEQGDEGTRSGPPQDSHQDPQAPPEDGQGTAGGQKNPRQRPESGTSERPADGPSATDQAAETGESSPREQTAEPTDDRASTGDRGDSGGQGTSPDARTGSQDPQDPAPSAESSRNADDDDAGSESPRGAASGDGSERDGQGPPAADEGDSAGSPPSANNDSTEERDSQDQSGDAESKPTPRGGATAPQSAPSSSPSGTPGQSTASRPSRSSGSSSEGAGMADGEGTGDDANLEYAKEVTDLVLEYLQDHKRDPDQELLDKLGWQPDDVDRFLRRWDELRRRADEDGPAAAKAQNQLDDVLRSLRLQSSRAGARRANSLQDQRRDNRNSGRRTKVPAELLDPFRAFQRSIRSSGG